MMKITNITLEFTSEEMEAIHYAMNIGIMKHRKDKCKIAKDWIDTADNIRKKLPIRIRMNN